MASKPPDALEQRLRDLEAQIESLQLRQPPPLTQVAADARTSFVAWINQLDQQTYTSAQRTAAFNDLLVNASQQGQGPALARLHRIHGAIATEYKSNAIANAALRNEELKFQYESPTTNEIMTFVSNYRQAHPTTPARANPNARRQRRRRTNTRAQTPQDPQPPREGPGQSKKK
jgi:ABC-type transporter Mla subunit MlaD